MTGIVWLRELPQICELHADVPHIFFLNAPTDARCPLVFMHSVSDDIGYDMLRGRTCGMMMVPRLNTFKQLLNGARQMGVRELNVNDDVVFTLMHSQEADLTVRKMIPTCF